jgi:hypothetical protein
MSTNIADLPGPAPEEYEDNISEESFEDVEDKQQQPVFAQQQQSINSQKQDVLYEQPSKIKMDVKKVHKRQQNLSEEKGMFDIIRSEVNEENLLILIILYIASTSLIDEYAKKILTMISFNISNLSLNIVKAIGLLLLFIIAKNFLLPYIRV